MPGSVASVHLSNAADFVTRSVPQSIEGKNRGWEQLFFANKKATFYRRPLAVDYQSRLRSAVVTFKLDVEQKGNLRFTSSTPNVAVRLSSEQCAATFGVACKSCVAHAVVPVSVELEGFNVVGTPDDPVYIQLMSNWPHFGQKAHKTAYEWFGVHSRRVTLSVSSNPALPPVQKYEELSPQIGYPDTTMKGKRPERLFYANTSFAVPENFDILKCLLGLDAQSARDESSVLHALGVQPARQEVDGDDAVLIQQPDTRTNVAPSLMSYEVSRSFSRLHNGTSRDAVKEWTRDADGNRKEGGGFWKCSRSDVMQHLQRLQREFTARPIIMDITGGLSLVFTPGDRQKWIEHNKAYSIECTLKFVYIVI
jgi:hypothetical protein